MSQRLDETLRDEKSPNGSACAAMVYLCLCGARWTNSMTLTPAWECKCGRQLVQRKGIIHAAIGQARAQTERAPRIVLIAAG
jgi:hypothetical protein